MYLYFDRSGTLKEMYNPDIERVGNSNVNKLYIYWELAEDLTITGLRTRYKLEDNSNYPTTPDYVNQYTVATSKIPYDKKEDLKFFKFFKDYQFYVVNVPDEVLAKDGAVICSAWFVYGNNIQAMGKFAFAVDGDTDMVKPDYNINIAQWNSLITLLKNNFNFFAVATINGLDLSYYNEKSIIWDLSDGKIYQLQNGELIELGFPTLPYVPIKTTTGEFVYTHNGAVQGEKEFEAVLMTADTSKIPSSSAVLSSISELAVPKRNTSGLHVYSQNGGLQSELAVDEASLGNDDYSTHIPTSGLVKRAIEEIKNNPDVVDIVETKADLDNYDTSSLGDKDIIRVLVDETHDGASTFYRWNLSQKKWDYIGKAGDYYTKSEVNTLLVGKLDKKTTTGEFVYTHNGATQGEMEVKSSITPSDNEIPTSNGVISMVNTLIADKQDKLDVEVPAHVDADINLTLENNKQFRYGVLYGAINISFPSNPELDFMCELDIQSLPSMSYPNNIKWSGDDIENGVFVPDSQALTPYQILFYTSGVSNNIWNAIVRKPSV